MLSGGRFVLGLFLLVAGMAAIDGKTVWAEVNPEAEKQEGQVLEAPKTEMGKTEITIWTPLLFEEPESYVPDGIYTDEMGGRYWLKEWELEPELVPARKMEIKRDLQYEGVEEKEQIPAKIPVKAADSITGEELEEECPILQIECLKEFWSSDFSFTAVFHSYDADYYLLGGKQVPFNADRPEIEGCQEQLLQEIGVEPERYRITGVSWAGPPYLEEGGELCRDAAVTGEKQVADYLVTYGGTAVFPEKEGFRCRAVYRSFDAEPENWYPAEEAGTGSEPVMLRTPADSRRLVFQRTVILTLSLLAAAVVFLLLWLVWKGLRKRKGGNENEES